MKEKNIVNPIVIHPHLLQKFMKQGKHYSNLLALYSFYLYHAQLQKTNKPLATDEFVKNGLNWALDRVKKTKKILKELKVIEVVQHKKYYYIHLFFIYTKKKIADFFQKDNSTPPTKEKQVEIKKEEKIEPKKVEKSPFEKELIKNSINSTKIKTIRETILSIKGIEDYRFNSLLFGKWIVYCEKNSIRYSKNNLKHWLDRLDKRVTIEQKEAVKTSISRGWKSIYLKDKKESKYYKFLGKSIFLNNKLFNQLQDIDIIDNKFIYRFKNITIKMDLDIETLFSKYEYTNNSMALNVKNKIMGVIKRF
jgi:hypothetical protein